MRKKQKDWCEFARITDESGDFNVDCDARPATAMLKAGLLDSYDGDDDHGYCVEHFYTVSQENEQAVLDWLAKAEGRE